MFDLTVLAYPILLAAIYGAYRVGRRRALTERSFEWVRACSLALLLAILIVVEMRLVMTGVVSTTFGLVGAGLGVLATAALLGLNLFEMFNGRDEGAAAKA